MAQHRCVQHSTNLPINGLYNHDYAYRYDTTRFGRLEAVTSVNSDYGTDTSYSYDTYDRVISKTQTMRTIKLAGGTQPTRKVSYGYSLGGKLSSLTLPSGRVIGYTYDTTRRGQLNSMTLDGSPLLSSIRYNGAGLTSGWTWANGANYAVTYEANASGKIKTITNASASNVLNYKADYVYDGDGRTSYITGLTTRDSFTYDKVDHLLTENRINLSGGTAVYSVVYTYDKNGNRLTLTGTGTHQQPAATVSYSYTANSNRLATITRNGVATTATYRPEGELLLDFAGGYDAYGQRRQSGKYNNTATLPEYYYGYNHKRERTVRSILNNGQTWAANAIQYVYDEDSHLIGEYKSDGTPIVEYVWKGDVPVVAIYGATTATKTYQIITDALNTPRRLMDPATNAVVWSWDSTAFGVAPPSVETVKFNLRFPGQVYDDLTKQHYNLNRYYNPELGRYMEADPIGLEGGLNPYAYVGSNPVNAVDPIGLSVNITLPDLSLLLDRSVPLPNINLPNINIAINGAMSALSRAIPIASTLSLTADSPQYLPIYRAMNQVELGRTMKYGYQMGNGSFDSGKQFTMWPSDAYKLAKALPNLDLPEHKYNYRVVTSMISKEVLYKSQISQGQIDIGIIKGPVLTVPSNQLPQLNRDARITGGIKLLPKDKPWWIF